MWKKRIVGRKTVRFWFLFDLWTKFSDGFRYTWVVQVHQSILRKVHHSILYWLDFDNSRKGFIMCAPLVWNSYIHHWNLRGFIVFSSKYLVCTYFALDFSGHWHIFLQSYDDYFFCKSCVLSLVMSMSTKIKAKNTQYLNNFLISFWSWDRIVGFNCIKYLCILC